MNWADLNTATGAISLAASIILLVQVLKAALPSLFTKVTGATAALVLSLVLYVMGAAISAAPADGWLGWGLAWLSCAAASIGIHSAVSQGTSTFVADS
jgi:hypothetical protein